VAFSENIAQGAAECPGCGLEQCFESGESGLSVFYRLNSLVDRASDLGVIPHLLAIDALTRRDQYTYLLPGVNVWLSGMENNKEVDLFGVHAGNVVAGEVKTSGAEFTQRELEKDIFVCVKLGVDAFVMAATDQIPDESIGIAEELCRESGLNLIVLHRSDLLPEEEWASQ
jgi:hypothetical protein